MPHQQVLSFPRVPTYQEHMLNIIERSHHSIHAFGPRKRSLKMFPWCILIHWHLLTFTRSVEPFLCRPLRDSVHVLHNKWCYYCKNHEFLNPSCFCALFQLHGEALRYTEAAIYLLLNGCYRGEWVVESAKGCCRYLDKSLFPLKIACPYTTSPSTPGEALQEAWAPSQELPKKKCTTDVWRC